MKKSLLLCLLACTALLGAPPQSEKEMTEAIRAQKDELLKMVVAEVSKQLPQKVDGYTTYVGVEARENTLVNVYEINTGAKSHDTVVREDKARMEKAVVAGSCGSSRRFLENGIDLEYIYQNALTKAELFRFHVDRLTCGY